MHRCDKLGRLNETALPATDGPRLQVERALLLAVALFGFVAGVFPLFDADIFWHLAAGRWIFEHGRVPDVDPFRFTGEGLPWVDHEWLFQVIAHGVERAGGLAALFWLRAAALGAFAALLFRIGRRAGLAAGLAALVAIGATLGARPRFLIRPEIATLFVMLLFLGLLERWADASRRGEAADLPVETRRRPARLLVGLVALVVLWVNLHGEALLAPGLAGLFLLGRALDEGGFRAALRDGPKIVGVPVLFALALLVNPYGWRLIEVPLGIRGALADLSAVNLEWLSAFRAPQPYLFGAMAVVAAIAALAWLAEGRAPSPEWGLPALAMAIVALSAVRHQALFFTLAAPYAALCLARINAQRPLSALAERRLAVGAFATVAALALWCAFPPASGPLRPRHGGLAWGLGLAPGRFPVEIVDKLAARPEIGPLYNEMLAGGYLLWRTHPPRKVFLEGRMELDPGLLREIELARRDGRTWRALLARTGVVGALVPYDERRVPVFERSNEGALVSAGAAPIHSLLFPDVEWVLVDWDDAGLLFLTRAEAARAWPEPPYRFVNPEDPERLLERARNEPGFRDGALAELARKLQESPGNARARELEQLLRSDAGAEARAD